MQLLTVVHIADLRETCARLVPTHGYQEAGAKFQETPGPSKRGVMSAIDGAQPEHKDPEKNIKIQ